MRVVDPQRRLWRVERNILPWRPRAPWLLRRSPGFMELTQNEFGVIILLVALVVVVPLAVYWLVSWTLSILCIPLAVLARYTGLAGHRVLVARLDRPRGDASALRVHSFPADSAEHARKLRADIEHRIRSGAPVVQV